MLKRAVRPKNDLPARTAHRTPFTRVLFRRMMQLPAADIGLALEAACMLTFFRIALNFLPVQRLTAWMGSGRTIRSLRKESRRRRFAVLSGRSTRWCVTAPSPSSVFLNASPLTSCFAAATSPANSSMGSRAMRISSRLTPGSKWEIDRGGRRRSSRASPSSPPSPEKTSGSRPTRASRNFSSVSSVDFRCSRPQGRISRYALACD